MGRPQARPALVPYDTANPRALPLEPADTIAVVLEHPSGGAVGTKAAGRCGVLMVKRPAFGPSLLPSQPFLIDCVFRFQSFWHSSCPS